MYPTQRAGTKGRSLPFVLAVALLALLPFAGPAQAHGEQFMRAEKIWPLLDKQQPEELEGIEMRIQHGDPGPWLIAENNTGETLEIQDANGEPFLRIGPEGVEYNRFAEEYYLTKWKGQIPEEVRENPDAEAEWIYLDDGQSWQWLDRRIVTEAMDVAGWVPMEARQAREDVDVGEWSIPARLGEAETEVQGVYRYDAPPKGDYAAILTSESKNSDVSLQLVHGANGSWDALSLQNRSGEPLTIFGRSGEPAIRIGPEDVQVNINSAVGRAADVYGSNATPASVEEEPLEVEQPEWKKVSAGSSLTWLDPRLRAPSGQAEPLDPEVTQEVARWEIPIEVAGEEDLLAGVIEWEFYPWEPPEAETQTSGADEGISFGEIATVGAVTVIPALAIMAVLLGPGLYKRYRYRR